MQAHTVDPNCVLYCISCSIIIENWNVNRFLKKYVKFGYKFLKMSLEKPLDFFTVLDPIFLKLTNFILIKIYQNT